jgi:hypothetical protein
MFHESVIAASIASLGLTVMSTPSNAAEPIATFSRIDGFAVVSQGAQYIKAHEGMPLSEGDRLMMLEGGTATIVFKDGCQYQIADDELLSIGATSTCASKGAGSLKIDPTTAISQNAPDSQHLQLAAAPGAAVGAGAVLTGASSAAIALGSFAGLTAVVDQIPTGSGDRKEISP